MKKILLITVSLLMLLTPFTLLAAENVRFSSTAEIEVAEVNATGAKVLVRKPAELVQPGDLVIYTNLFTNTGRQPAENIVIDNPVPENTEYLSGSATEADYVVTFSVDGGKSFAGPEQLTVADDKGGRRPATSKDYTHIRWAMQPPLQPGATGSVEFRVRVK